MKLKAIVVALMAGLLATPALAQEPKTSWTGFYVGVTGGLDMPTADLRYDPGFFGPYHADRMTGNGLSYGVTIGADYHIPGSFVVVGVGADHVWSDAAMSFAMPLGTTGAASLEKSWAVFGRLGVVMGNAMPYVLAGYTQADAKAAGTFLWSGGGGSETLKGWMAGGGIEFMLTQNISLAGEYRFTRFDDLSLAGGDLTIDPERHEMRATLKYKANFF